MTGIQRVNAHQISSTLHIQSRSSRSYVHCVFCNFGKSNKKVEVAHHGPTILRGGIRAVVQRETMRKQANAFKRKIFRLNTIKTRLTRTTCLIGDKISKDIQSLNACKRLRQWTLTQFNRYMIVLNCSIMVFYKLFIFIHATHTYIYA